MPENLKEYVCGLCGETFENDEDDWTEEQKLAEMQSFFGDVPPEECASVCEGCWLKIHPQRN